MEQGRGGDGMGRGRGRVGCDINISRLNSVAVEASWCERGAKSIDLDFSTIKKRISIDVLSILTLVSLSITNNTESSPRS